MNGGNLIVGGDLVVEQSSEYKGLVSINAGYSGIDSTALRVAYGSSEFGCSEINIGTSANGESAASSYCRCWYYKSKFKFIETNIAITTSFVRDSDGTFTSGAPGLLIVFYQIFQLKLIMDIIM